MDDPDSLRKSLQIYRGLVEVSGLINSITDFEELIRSILDVARRVMHAEAASLFLVNSETGQLELAIASQATGEFVQPQIPIPEGKGIAGWVYQHRECLLIPDAYQDERFYPEVDKITGFHTRSMLCAPLITNDQVIGVLQVLNPTGKSAFEAEDFEGFVVYSNLTAIALDKLSAIAREKARERLERELAIAAEIQTELLSHAIPSNLPGVFFASYNVPAQNVGGDFFTVFVRNPYEVYFAIGDVSGKGIPAALLMAQTLSAMQFVFAATTSPASALEKLNTTLHERIVRGMFVTALVGRLTPSSHRLELASAGHCRPYLIRTHGEVEEVHTAGALPLGILPRVNYHQSKLHLARNDYLVCFTDGLSESRNSKTNAFFDTELPALLSKPFSSAQTVIDCLVAAERKHRGTDPQMDDLTILVGGFP